MRPAKMPTAELHDYTVLSSQCCCEVALDHDQHCMQRNVSKLGFTHTDSTQLCLLTRDEAGAMPAGTAVDSYHMPQASAQAQSTAASHDVHAPYQACDGHSKAQMHALCASWASHAKQLKCYYGHTKAHLSQWLDGTTTAAALAQH